ncbi:MAG TPA: hypothetical protein VL475_02220 [Planctomycetaceae bacterium]|jgi:hypothetical protein|nr:hypothetical protein [Planctomycetaceae bacterium]
METGRKKPGWMFWLTVTLIALPVLYVASFGPACWLLARSQDDLTVRLVFMHTFRPLGPWLCQCSKYTNRLPERVINAGMPTGTRAIFFDDGRGGECGLDIRQGFEETHYIFNRR